MQPANNQTSITPTYSTDRDILVKCFPSTSEYVASSLTEAKTIFSQWGISNDSTFQRRVKGVDTDTAWIEFVRSCIMVGSTTNVDMNSLLRKCYTVAFSMPPSPVSHARIRNENIPSVDAMEPLSI